MESEEMLLYLLNIFLIIHVVSGFIELLGFGVHFIQRW